MKQRTVRIDDKNRDQVLARLVHVALDRTLTRESLRELEQLTAPKKEKAS